MNENKEYITLSEGNGNVNISHDVLATVAAEAALEIEGDASMAGVSTVKEIARFFSGKKGGAHCINVEVAEDNSLCVDITILLNIGCEIGTTAQKVQSAVAEAIEATTGLKVSTVNVRISGLALDR